MYRRKDSSNLSSGRLENVIYLSLATAAGLLLFLSAGCSPSSTADQRKLRVCADPNNLPFSNDRLEGLENQLAEVVAAELHADLEYFWWPQRRGFVRNTLDAGRCDVILGVPKAMDRTLTTTPYYRSSYVFATRSDRGLFIQSFDSPLLRELRVGVHVIGDDFASTPPMHALERRQILENVVGYRLMEDYRLPNPPARLLDALVDGDIDVAIAWGPLAGYFAKQKGLPIELSIVSPAMDASLPMAYDISMGVRRGESNFRDQLDAILARRRPDIDRILDEYGIPRVISNGEKTASEMLR
jgi:quinoprotein dehydrogenase-associated probable ABC transporter substrate-binding protein